MKPLNMFFIIIIIAGCVQKPEGEPIGFSTRLAIENEGKLTMTERRFDFFQNTLQGDPDFHFSGKLLIAFDTIFTSTLQRSIGDNPAAMIENEDSVFIFAVNQSDFPSVFFRRHEWFIYRTFVPEPDHRQTIILDVADKDSMKISSYFAHQKMNEIIIK